MYLIFLHLQDGFMPVTTLKRVGKFNEKFKWHLDNEWLGRLSETSLVVYT